MADLEASLLRALDGAAPQHKKAEEQALDFTEGEQGKMFVGNHVKTESGIWVPQKGTDDGASKVQVTGSNVAEELFTDVVVAPGSSVSTDFKYYDGSEIGVMIFWYSPTKFEVRARERALSIENITRYHTAIEEEEGSSRSSARFKQHGNRMDFQVRNNDTEEREIRNFVITNFY